MRAPIQERWEVSVRGIVQGVGFRPFVYALALRHGLAGLVRNDAEGVQVEVEGDAERLDLFLRGIEEEAPPLAVVEAVSWRPLAALGERGFRIEESREGFRRRALISPDVATCEECLREVFDPGDRRYRYPFTNCTNCGPRFTITRAVPYDRDTTTMSRFEMCPECRREYDDPADRRFHAQPNACPTCGPRVRLLDKFGHRLHAKPDDPIPRTARMLRGRAIVAIKGLGGYHLACDPFDERAVRALRGRKVRQDKPFALMAKDLDQVRKLCRVGSEEEALLTSPARPIVLLERRDASPIAESVAPRQSTLGVMLAYTPLHHLLIADAGIPLVMTSGNNSDEPSLTGTRRPSSRSGRSPTTSWSTTGPSTCAPTTAWCGSPEERRTPSGAPGATHPHRWRWRRISGGTSWHVGGSSRTPSAWRRNATSSLATTSGTLRTTRPCVHSGKESNFSAGSSMYSRKWWLTTYIPSISPPNTPANWRRRGFRPWAYSTITRTLRVAWPITVRRAGSASSELPWTGPATGPTGPCGAESFSRVAWRKDSRGGDTWNTPPCPVDRRPSGNRGGWRSRNSSRFMARKMP